MNVRELIGMSLEQGTKLAHKHKYAVRVVREDNQNIAYSLDVQDRVNLEVDNGKITNAFKG